MINPRTSIDVRTIDFLRIVEALQREKNRSQVANRLLGTVDDFGMNVICADELDAADFAEFAEFVNQLQNDYQSDESGFRDFLSSLRNLIAQDKRINSQSDPENK